MAFGSLVPGMAPFQPPPMAQGGLFGAGLGQQGMGILMAALRQNQGRSQQQPGPMNILPSAARPGILSPWLNRAPTPGLLPDMGGVGPAPNAISGLW